MELFNFDESFVAGFVIKPKKNAVQKLNEKPTQAELDHFRKSVGGK